MPDIRTFSVYNNRHLPFAKYDHLHKYPPKAFLDGFMKICEFARRSDIRLNSQFIKDEQRAYLALKNGEYCA